MDRATFLAERKKGIGGSDAGAIAGINPWATPLDVYQDKLDLSDPDPEDDLNDRLFWGTRLEDTIADVFSERTGMKVQRRNSPIVHPQHSWMRANLDRVIVSQEAGPGVLECKTADSRMAKYWGEPGTDEVPDYYLSQVAHYMAVTGYTWARLAVLIGGNDFRVYNLPRDEDLIHYLIQLEQNFWENNVQAQVAPDPMTIADIAKLWPKDNAKRIMATPEIQARVAQYMEFKQKLKDLDKSAEAIKAEIMLYMEDNAVLLSPNGKTLATWKTNKTRRLKTKELRAELPDLADKYTNVSTQRRFLGKNI